MPACCTHKLSGNMVLRQSRKSFVPDEGWTSESFRTRNGLNLVRDIMRVQKQAQAKGMESLAAWLQTRFRDLLEEIIARVFELKERAGHRLQAKSILDEEEEDDDYSRIANPQFTVNEEEDRRFWAIALVAVLGSFDDELTTTMPQRYQSVAGGVYGRTTTLLGVTPAPNAATRILARVRPMGVLVTRINETTRNRMEEIIREGIDKGRSVDEVARELRRRLPEIATNRIPTIARTEMGRAADQGAALAYETSGIVTHVSVIGCKAIEKGIPEYNGVPTCNIRNVPVNDAWSLEFHINHTGLIVPTGFRNRDGSSSPLIVEEGFGLDS